MQTFLSKKAAKTAALIIATASLSLLSMTAMANTVAVWNSQQAIASSNYGKAKLAGIQASVQPKQQQLQNYKATIDRLQQQYSQQYTSLTDAQKQAMEQQVRTNMESYEQVANQIQSIISANEADVLQKIGPKLEAIRNSIVQQKNIDVLIDNRDHTISYVKPEWELTQEFINKINEQVR